MDALSALLVALLAATFLLLRGWRTLRGGKQGCACPATTARRRATTGRGARGAPGA